VRFRTSRAFEDGYIELRWGQATGLRKLDQEEPSISSRNGSSVSEFLAVRSDADGENRGRSFQYRPFGIAVLRQDAKLGVNPVLHGSRKGVHDWLWKVVRTLSTKQYGQIRRVADREAHAVYGDDGNWRRSDRESVPKSSCGNARAPSAISVSTPSRRFWFSVPQHTAGSSRHRSRSLQRNGRRPRLAGGK
jgi:hypothetical protein